MAVAVDFPVNSRPMQGGDGSWPKLTEIGVDFSVNCLSSEVLSECDISSWDDGLAPGQGISYRIGSQDLHTSMAGSSHLRLSGPLKCTLEL